MNTQAFFLGALIAGSLLSACGPSQRRTYQSDNAFARCFDRDYNPDVNIVQKKNCWSNWLMSRQYNQPDDKTKYARLRLSEIADGISIPGPPGPPGRFDHRPALPSQPPATEADAGVKGPSSPPGIHSAKPTSADCEEGCRASFETCSKECGADAQDAGASTPCTKACDAGYRSCMKTCFN